MALSDSCSEFLTAVEDAACTLAENARWYSSPDYPIRYGEEARALLRASMKAAGVESDPEAVSRLIRLAAAVMNYHFVPPGHPDEPQLRREMDALVRIVQAEPGPDGT